MKEMTILGAALILIFISQLLMSFGYDFLMSQEPFDYAHWSLLIGSLMMLVLWKVFPDNLSKTPGLILMSIGVAGIIGMCTLDILFWALHSDTQLKDELLNNVMQNPSIQIPFLIAGPSLFYAGMAIASYALIKRFTWQVLILNAGALMIGLGHMILHNRIIPVVGALFLLVSILSIVRMSSASEVKA